MAQGAQNFDAMRQDAIRRSREMQRRAVPPSAPEPPPKPPPAHETPPPSKPSDPPAGELHELLESLHLSGELRSLLHGWDGEKLALAGLLYLLWKEGTDPALLLALAYILL